MAENISHGQPEALVADNMWFELNNDVAESILKRLPTESVAMFRRVCKDWNNLLSSQYFLTWRRENIKEQPWLLIISDRSDCYRLSVVTKEVKPFPIHREIWGTVGGLIVTTNWPRNNRQFLYNPLNETQTRMEDVNAVSEDYMVNRAIVCNPATETFVETYMRGTTVGDILWRDDQYQLVAIHETSIEVYDRSKHSWVTVQIQLPRRFPVNIVFFKGLFFCMMIIPCILRSHANLMVFRINEDCTCHMVSLSLPMPFSHRLLPPLMHVCGSTFILATQDPFKLYLWELVYGNNLSTSSDLSWKAIGSMPQEVFDFATAGLDRSYVTTKHRFKSLVVGKYICFVRMQGKNMVFFNTENRSWSCFAAGDNVEGLSHIGNAYVFEPRLDLLLQSG